MGGTADKLTPLGTPWREALTRAGSFDALRPYLHEGRIPARHGGLRTLSDGKVHSGPGDFKPEWWAHADKDRAGRVIFFTEPVVSGYTVIQEQVFAYDISIELDSVAFDSFFPVAGLPPAEPAASPPAPALDEPPPEEAEQQRPLLLLPDEPQFEPPRKWRPDEVQTWFANAKQIYPRKPGEDKSAYARRLYYEHMEKDFEEDNPWTEWKTLRRRLDDPSTKND